MKYYSIIIFILLCFRNTSVHSTRIAQSHLLRNWPQFAQSENEIAANAYLQDLGLNWKDLEDKEILDIGAGLARFALAAKQKGVRVISIDLHPEWHTETDARPTTVPYIVADAREPLPFPDESFDVIVARASIHSIVEVQEDMEAIFTEAKRLLKPDGEFRFGPGSISMRPVRHNEWDKWFDLLKRVENHEYISPEEDAWGAKVWPRYEREQREYEKLKDLPGNERKKRQEERTLADLQNIELAITAHPITRILVGWNGENTQTESVYYVMKNSLA